MIFKKKTNFVKPLSIDDYLKQDKSFFNEKHFFFNRNTIGVFYNIKTKHYGFGIIKESDSSINFWGLYNEISEDDEFYILSSQKSVNSIIYPDHNLYKKYNNEEEFYLYKTYFNKHNITFNSEKTSQINLKVENEIKSRVKSIIKTHLEKEKRENEHKILTQKKAEQQNQCYIATMIYKNPEHINIIRLKLFRDNYLKSFLIGRVFIKYYYKYSPLFVASFKNNKTVNKIIKYFLDKIIQILPSN